MNEHIFALDIGTQSVTGILLEKKNDTYNVVDFCVRKHNERSMLDGQIQNVIQVAEVISEVKNELEKEHGPLENVSVAAAGRALKTIHSETTIDISQHSLTNPEEIKHLELSAVQNAQVALTNDSNLYTNYHCVGYSVIHYKLDGEIIGSFIDQIGNKATVEIIATFLPRIVVESLLSALNRAGLKMQALTLEPIAAIHVLIPESMRRLNVALIDIGAGTSDIAITNHGTITAYGMVPIAGDEITEAISDQYLLDFKVAEQAKREVVNEKKVLIQDILGIDLELTYDQLIPDIINRVDKLASQIAEELLSLNAKPPQAVMLIGGGSLTPKIDEILAERLGLPINRVVIRGIEAIQILEKKDMLPSGPDFVTPIGIAISANQSPLHYISVSVNDRVTLMFETKQLTIGDCLIQAGIEVKKYYGKPGLAKMLTVNDESVTIRGEYGKAPIIYLNGEIATVDSIIQSNDEIVIERGIDGLSVDVTIEEIVGQMDVLTFIFNGEEKAIEPIYTVNYEQTTKDYFVKDNDNIVVKRAETISDFLEANSIAPIQSNQPFFVFVNRKRVNIERGSTQILLNGNAVPLGTIIHNQNHLQIILSERVTVKTLLKQQELPYSYVIAITFNGKSLKMKKDLVSVKRHEARLNEESVLHQGDNITIDKLIATPFIFQDIFRFVDVDMTTIQGRYKLYCNGEETAFPEPIKDGDNLEISWGE